MLEKKIIVLVGPSGSGKTTIGKALSYKGIPKLITTTTRAPREAEENGIDYYFRDFNELDSKGFVEQTVYNENRYGLTIKEVSSMLDQHNVVHVSLDQQGAEAVKKAYPKEAIIVFIPINQEEMITRMKQRGDTLEEINERIEYSQETGELNPPPETDLIIENKKVEDTAQKIIDEILGSQKTT